LSLPGSGFVVACPTQAAMLIYRGRENISVFFKFPEEIRRIIYTTK